MPLGVDYSNPQCMVSDVRGSVLYVGLKGGPSLLKINTTTFRIIGYATLPASFYSIQGRCFQTNDHYMYLHTYQQRGGLIRVSADNFCPTECPQHGFCNASICVCNDGYVMKNSLCALTSPSNIVEVDVGAAIALGILFALSFVLAAAGWGYVWILRKSHYSRI